MDGPGTIRSNTGTGRRNMPGSRGQSGAGSLLNEDGGFPRHYDGKGGVGATSAAPAGRIIAPVHGAVLQRAWSACSTSSAWPGTRTFGQLARTLPSWPIRKVARWIPMDVRPYMLFSTQTP